MQNYFHKS